ncbi:unnamed protein product [Rangifer tarandus platyrhynchus]|uniref:Uncharacterized protein n=1 Tax=Rangifer tarandus platyrhynchus TaxID=3082113 RepID=A0AC59ZD11_RANTA
MVGEAKCLGASALPPQNKCIRSGLPPSKAPGPCPPPPVLSRPSPALTHVAPGFSDTTHPPPPPSLLGLSNQERERQLGGCLHPQPSLGSLLFPTYARSRGAFIRPVVLTPHSSFQPQLRH